ncbi:MAG TPA: DUF1194 domain-containing protein [Verrucomicrobiae bacterium]|jgi:hypothetical protein|nr:DUF1194 domain-containing protein [Verrucomicrobiae bacterium]
MSEIRPRLAFIVLAALLSVLLRNDVGAQGRQVDLALVLAIDCSFSVDANEFRLQMEGIGKAFLEPDVKTAIKNGPNGQIAVAAIQWSDENNQMVIVPWRILASDKDVDDLGTLLARMPRRLAEGGTSISMAIQYSARLLSEAPATGRRVIDISSDGRNNIGPPVNTMRDRIVAEGITINALTILNEWPTLDTYFERYVIGGQGAFVIPANDYVAYSKAIYRKLLREITGPGIS